MLANRHGGTVLPRPALLGAIAATGALLLLAGLVSSARAASYTEYVCKAPDGSATSGAPWSGTGVGYLRDNCAFGGDLEYTLSMGGDRCCNTFSLDLPADVTAVRHSAWRDLSTPAGGSVSTPWDPLITSPTTVSNPYNAAAPSAPQVRADGTAPSISFACQAGYYNGCGPQVTVRVHKLDIVLRDTAVPTITSPAGGELLDGSWHTATTGTLDLGASDQGAGAYRLFLREGATTRYASVDADNATCRDAVPGNADPYEFRNTADSPLRPCRIAAQLYSGRFDLTALGDGTHTVSIGVEDAAGNERVASTGRTIKVNAPGGALPDPGTACAGGTVDASGACVAGSGGGTTGGGGGGGGVTPVGAGGGGGGGGGTTTTATTAAPAPAPAPALAPISAGAASLAALRPNGGNAAAGGSLTSRFALTEKRQLQVGYGKKVTVRGQLVNPKGVPVAHAQIEVITYARVPGAQPIRLTPVTTDSQGNYSVTLPAGASRLVRLAYRTYLDDLDFSQVSDLDLRVITKVHLSSSPKSIRNGSTVRFSGSIDGAPSGSRKVVEMQVLQGTHWVTFGTTRITHGRFAYRYRFTRTFHTTRYAFRAIVRTDAGWQYETGTSPAKHVTVRP